MMSSLKGGKVWRGPDTKNLFPETGVPLDTDGVPAKKISPSALSVSSAVNP